MMKNVFTVITTVLLLVISTESTDFNKCKDGRSSDAIKELSISNCEHSTCKLKRGTTIKVEETFVPDRDVQSLTTSVYATISNIPLPFIGVDGSDACGFIYDTEDKKVRCPLKKGVEYVYKNEFPVLSFYPKVSLIVYWALVENGKVVSCFEVPAKITN